MRDWFRFVAAKADTPPVLYIYGDIGTTYFDEDGVSAQMFVDQLDAIKDSEFHVRINSPGGSAWDGLAIANAMIRHDAFVTTFVDGMAASAASVVMLGGNEVVVNKWARAMLHNARAMVMGTSDDMRDVATQIDALNANMASFYADRSTGSLDAAAFARAMEAETWYSATDMLAAGLATRIDASGVREEVERAAASALASTRMVFRNPPAAITKENPMATKDDLAKRLGKDPADVTDDDLMKAALDALGDAPASTDTPDAPPAPAPASTDTPDAPPAPAADAPAAAAAAAKSGVVEVDAAVWETMQANAALGAQAYKDAQAASDLRVVMSAVDEGRIPLARKDHYLALMAADRTDTTDLLTKRLAPGAAVPLQEVGHAADVAAATASVSDDPRYTAFAKGLI